MTDQELALGVLRRLSVYKDISFEEAAAIERIIGFTHVDPPPGSVEVRVAVARYEANGHWYGVAEVEDELTPDPMSVAMRDPDLTHAAIVTAWIPPVRTPEVQGVVLG